MYFAAEVCCWLVLFTPSSLDLLLLPLSPAFVYLVIVKTGICLQKSPWEHQLLQLDKSCTG